MNQVERWFGLLTDKLIRRGAHTSVQALENDIKAGSPPGTTTPARSPGPRPQMRSWIPLPATSPSSEQPARQTRKINSLNFRRRILVPWQVTFAPLCSSGGSGHPRPSVDHPCPPPGCWPHRVLRGERPEEPWRADPGGRPVDRRAFTIGLAIAAVAWTSGAARGIMAATFYPLMFFPACTIRYSSCRACCSTSATTRRSAWRCRRCRIR